MGLENEIEALLATDRAWAQAAAGDDIDQICEFWSDDSVLYDVFGSGQNVVGLEAIRAFVTKARSQPGRSLRWTPTEAFVSATGDVGCTRGTHELTYPGDDGQPVTIRGTYTNIWKKSADGRWQCAFETHEADQ